MKYFFTQNCYFNSEDKTFYRDNNPIYDEELKPVCMRIIQDLCEHSSGFRSATDIYSSVMPDGTADNKKNSIERSISKIREMLKNTGYPVSIKNKTGIGYYLQPRPKLFNESTGAYKFERENLWDAGYNWFIRAKGSGQRFNDLNIKDTLFSDTCDFDIYLSKNQDRANTDKKPLLTILDYKDGANFDRDNLFFIGEGGIGKTYALMWIMSKSYNNRTNKGNPIIPFSIFVELSKAPDYYCEATYGKNSSVMPSFIRRTIYRQLMEKDSVDSTKDSEYYWNLPNETAVAPVDQLLTAYQEEVNNKPDGSKPCLILLFDGLNEVSTATIDSTGYTVREYVIKEINYLMETYPSIKFILTSRMEHNVFSSETIVPHWLRGIDDDNVRDYLTNNANLPVPRIDEICKNKKLMELLRVPIFLRMFAPLAQDQEIAKDLTTRGGILQAFLTNREKIIYNTLPKIEEVQQGRQTPNNVENRNLYLSPQMQHFILQFILPAIANEMEKHEAYQISMDSTHIRGITEILDDILPYTNIISGHTDKCEKTDVCGKYGDKVFAYHTPDGSGKPYTPKNVARKYLTSMLNAGHDRDDIRDHIVDYCVSTLGILVSEGKAKPTYSFIHQHFRDYFSALFYVNQMKLAAYTFHDEEDVDTARAFMKDLEDRFLPQIIREMIGEYLGENLNAPVQDEEGAFTYKVPEDESDRTLIKRVIDLYREEKPENKPAHYGVLNLFNIIKDVRKDLSGSDFHDLDLRECSFSYVPLDTCEGTNFTDSLINATTWFPMGHSEEVLFARFSKDMRKIISVGYDHSCRIWNAQTGNCEQIFYGCYGISYSGKFCLTYDIPTNYLRIWNTETGTCEYENSNIITMDERFDIPPTSTCISYNEKLVIFHNIDSNHYILLNIETGRIDFIRPGNCSKLSSCHFSHNDKYLCFVTGQRPDVQHIQIWDIDHQGVILNIETDHVNHVDFSADDKYILSSHSTSRFTDVIDNHWCKIWSSETGECIHTLPDQHDVDITPNGQYVTSSFYDSSGRGHYSINLWKMKSFEHIRTIKDAGHCILSNDGKYLAISDRLVKAITIRDLATNECIYTLKGHTAGIRSLYFSDDNRYLISGSDDLSIRVWDMETGNCVQVLEGIHFGISDIHFSKDGKCVLSASFDHTSKIMDVETGICTHLLEGHSDGVRHAFYSPDETYIATDSYDHSIRIYDAKSGRLLHSFANSLLHLYREKGDPSPFSPDGKYMISFRGNTDTKIPDLVIYETEDYDCVVVLEGIRGNYVWATVDGKNVLCIIDEYPSYTTWSPETGVRTLSFELPSEFVWSQDDKYMDGKQYSADGKYMFFYDRHYGYWINDTMTGKCISTCKNHNSNYIDAMCFSHNNQLIASGDNDWFRVIDRLNGKCVLESSAPDRGVEHVHFSHDDRLCISVTYIAVYVWELDSKQVLHTLKTPDLSRITDAIFSPDNKTILSSHADGRCIIWDIATGKPIKTLYSSASLKIRNLDFTKLDAASSFTDAQREQLRSMGGIIPTT